jgi:ABC-type transport system involved in cytochrome c biogenesis permease component
MEAFRTGLDWTSGLLLLSGYSLGAVALSPFAAAAAVRNALS